MRQLALCLGLAAVFSIHAQSVREVVPAAAPHGARVIITGSELDSGSIEVSFSGSAGMQVPATITARTAKFVEVTVPQLAVNGNVTVTAGGTAAGTVAFTVAPGVAWQAITTAAGGPLRLRGELLQPQGVAVDAVSGNVYIADTKNHQVKVLSPDGTLTVVAGRGQPGMKDGTGTAAELKEPRGLAWDAARNVLYVADSGNHAIRRITPAGAVTTLAGNGLPGDTDGAGSAARFKRPAAVAVDAQGDVLVADSDNHKIRRVTPAGTATTLAGTGRDGYAEGPVLTARFAKPEGIAVDAAGAVFVADTGNHRIRRIENGVVSLLAGDGRSSFADAAAEQSSFDRPGAVTIDDGGTLFVADTGNGLIRRIANGRVVTIAGRLNGPRNDPYDGAPLSANIHQPAALVFAGAIYIADTKNDAIRMLEPALRLTDIYPRRGPLAGGNEIRVFGAAFTPGSQVKIGFDPAPNVTFVTSTMLLVTMPAGTAGAVDIRVTSLGTTRALPAHYVYLPPPTILSISPTKGKTAGGQSALVRGTDLMDGETEVWLGSASATQVTVNDPTSVSVTTPAGTPGAVDLLARTPGGEARLENAFRYFAPPVLLGFTPPSGYPGANVTITGNHFDTDADGNLVSFGVVPAPSVAATSTTVSTVVPAGAVTARLSVTTAGGTATSATDFVVPVLASLTITPATVTLDEDGTQQLAANGTWSDGSSRDVTALVAWSTDAANVASVDASGLVRGQSAGTASITATLEGVTASASVKVESAETLPPSTVEAPPLSTTTQTPMVEGTEFLYTGPDAVQTGVAPGTIEAERAAVVRGRVMTRDRAPLVGVEIAILNMPQFGSTRTREDGAFDMAVNGGPMIVTYRKAGYLPVQRTVSASWQDFAVAPDVVMIPLDGEATVVQSGSPAQQFARGSVTEDSDGRRQATLIFPPQTEASIVLPDGTTQPLPTLTVRATEYTVGATGPAAMPGALPATTGYTYCVELSADEAMAAGAAEVRFSKPLVLYVENFLNFPVGGIVPTGYLDRVKGAWIPSNNGRVIKVLSIDGGLAAIDGNGDGAADNAAALAVLGVDDAERQRLAATYTAGTTLWRVPIPHFTPWDCNWPYGPPGGAAAPGQPPPTGSYWIRGGREECGSVIDCQNQTVGEVVSIPGAPFPLVYNSARVPGHDRRTLVMQISSPAPPASAKRFELNIEYGGRVITRSYPNAPSVREELELDLRDVYGRPLTGTVRAKVSLGYVYDAVYQEPAQFEKSFAALSGVPISGSRARQEITISQESAIEISSSRVDPIGFSGWSLGNHHVYDFAERSLYSGTGSQRSSAAADPGAYAIKTVVGTGQCCGTPVSGTARDVKIHALNFRIAPNGDIYLNEWDWVRKVDRNGLVTVVAGMGTSGPLGDGPALQRRINVDSIAIGPDGTLYINEGERIKRVRNGMIETIAGTGQNDQNDGGNGGPAVNATVNAYDIAVGPDSSVYLLDRNSGTSFRTVRRITPDGIITTIAGGGTDARDNIPALRASLPSYGIYVSDDGTIYLVDSNHGRIRTITPDGIIRRIAGFQGSCPTSSGDGGLAVNACVNDPFDVAVDREGMVYITEFSQGRIRAVTPDGIIATVAGDGRETNQVIEGAPATGTPVTFPWSVAVGPDGAVYFTEEDTYRVRRIERVLPRFAIGESFIASEDGREMHVFRGSRHMRTIDALTQTPLYTFAYNGAGLVSSVTDREGKVTQLERDFAGKLKAIVAATGQRTTLTADPLGQLTGITTASTGETRQFTYGSGGLMATMKTPRGHTYRFQYNSKGRLTKDSDPAGGFISLVRTGTDKDVLFSTTTAAGRTKSDRVQRFTDGSERRTHTTPAGLRVTTTVAASGSSVITHPDGTQVRVTEGPNARFGMQSPVPASLSIFTPAGLVWTGSMSTSATGPALDPTTLTSQMVTNGRATTTTFNRAAGTVVAVSPVGRQSKSTIDAAGRITRIDVPGFAPTTTTYTARGEVETLEQGGRISRFVYDASGQLISTTNSVNRTVTFEHDTAGRMRKQLLPGGRQIVYDYDANGNLTSVQPPGRPPYAFTYTSADISDTFHSPAVAGAVSPVQFTFDLDKQLTAITRPDGSAISATFDSGGRTVSINSPTRSIGYGYLATGRVGSITAPGASLSFVYDGPLLRRAAWSGSVSGALIWTYDNDFRPSSELVNGTPIEFGYDADSLLTRAGALTLTYDSQNGLLTGTALGTIGDSYIYNEFGEITGYAATSGGAPLLAFDYARDSGGRIASIGSRGFEYDESGRLVRVTEGGTPVAEYAWDANSNRTAHSWPGGANTASYDDQDRLLQYGDTTFEYTANGDLKSKTLAGAVTTYDYDALGGLQRVVLPGGQTIDYVLDGQNRRVGKKVDGALVQGWLYSDQLRIAAELDAANNVRSRFVYGSRENVADYMIRGGITYRILSDHRGSPRLVVNAADGTIVQRIEYDEFGRVLSDTNPGFQPFGFAGGLFDSDTGLIRFGARDYDPSTGRWTTKEPLGFASGETNFYSYVSGDPVNFIDPDGFKVYPINYVGPLEVGDTRGAKADLNDPRLRPLLRPTLDTAPKYYYPKGTPEKYKQECVSLTKNFTGLPCTGCWRAGPQVLGNNVAPGTAIATFDANGRYPKGDVPKNSGIFVAEYSGQVIEMIDQWPGNLGALRQLGPNGTPSNDSTAYSVIDVAFPCNTCY
jgi:RHS repeat-associated protein